MAEFKLKRGQKVYHIREFSSVVELTRRGLVGPEDPIFVPTVGRWVYARAIQELRPVLREPSKESEEADELPLEFVEPLAEDLDGGLTLEVDGDEIGIRAFTRRVKTLPELETRTDPGTSPIPRKSHQVSSHGRPRRPLQTQTIGASTIRQAMGRGNNGKGLGSPPSDLWSDSGGRESAPLQGPSARGFEQPSGGPRGRGPGASGAYSPARRMSGHYPAMPPGATPYGPHGAGPGWDGRSGPNPAYPSTGAPPGPSVPGGKASGQYAPADVRRPPIDPRGAPPDLGAIPPDPRQSNPGLAVPHFASSGQARVGASAGNGGTVTGGTLGVFPPVNAGGAGFQPPAGPGEAPSVWADRSHPTEIAKEFGRAGGKLPTKKLEEKVRSHKPGAKEGHAPIAFEDWMEQQGQKSVIVSGTSEEIAPLLDVKPTESRPASRFSLARVSILLAIALAGAGLYFWYVNRTANLEFQPLEVEAPPVEPTVEVQAKADRRPKTAEPGVLVNDTRLRALLRPQQSPMRTFDHAQDELFGELINLRVSVVDVKVDPVEGERTRSIRTHPSIVTVRIREGKYTFDEQSALIGLVVGKYAKRNVRDHNRLDLDQLVIRIERSEGEPLERKVAGQMVSDYFNRVRDVREYLLALQAGTDVP